ncbi:MAG: hypothetical protein PF904_05090 [Kiritimatiellae bacterium]|jgi:hypothetical protein|nr:hypothetical protein [Kiritimatiellia bacterium]
MSDSVEKNKSVGPENDKSTEVDEKKAVVLDLDFAPSWARTSPDDYLKSVKSSRFDSDSGGSYNRRSNSRDNRRGGGRDDRFSRNNRDNRKFGHKPPRRREFGQDRSPASIKPSKPAAPVKKKFSGVDQGQGGGNLRSGGGGGDYRPQNRNSYRGRPRFEHPPLALEVRILPEQKALGGVIRRIQSSHRAFPLRDIAWLFLDKPASCLVRLAQQKDEPLPLYQCKICGMPALSEEEMESHLLNRHLDDAFDVEEIECDMPGGQFVCVMRCGMTGVLLGPPNHHSYNTKVHDMLRTKFPNMSEEAYRRKIESVRETEVIEEWRQSCTKKKIYRRKEVQAVPAIEPVPTPEPVEAGVDAAPVAEGETIAPAAPVVDMVDNEVKAPPMDREVAELVFKREIMPKQYSSVKHMICIASTALQTPNKPLYFAIKDMLHKERRFPTSLFFALRGAFRHRKLHLFRANEAKGPDFVMQKKPSVLNPSHAVDLVKEVLSYIHEHPACTKVELVHALSNDEDVKIKETLAQLAWLIEKGNVIEYYNDVLSAPIEYPYFKLLSGEKKRGKRGESVTVSNDSPAPVKSEVATAAKPAKSAAEKAEVPVAEPTVEAKAEPAAEVKAEPAAEVKAEPAAKKVEAPVAEPVAEAKVEVTKEETKPEVKASEPVAEAKVEAVKEKKAATAKPKTKATKPKKAAAAKPAEEKAPAKPKAKKAAKPAKEDVVKESESVKTEVKPEEKSDTSEA